jgi:hypothetical protein
MSAASPPAFNFSLAANSATRGAAAAFPDAALRRAWAAVAVVTAGLREDSVAVNRLAQMEASGEAGPARRAGPHKSRRLRVACPTESARPSQPLDGVAGPSPRGFACPAAAGGRPISLTLPRKPALLETCGGARSAGLRRAAQLRCRNLNLQAMTGRAPTQRSRTQRVAGSAREHVTARGQGPQHATGDPLRRPLESGCAGGGSGDQLEARGWCGLQARDRPAGFACQFCRPSAGTAEEAGARVKHAVQGGRWWRSTGHSPPASPPPAVSGARQPGRQVEMWSGRMMGGGLRIEGWVGGSGVRAEGIPLLLLRNTQGNSKAR